VLTATNAHGWCTSVFMADSRVSHGGCAFIEILCQTLDHVLQVTRSRGRRFPSRLVVQSDNTVAQAKNAVVMLFLAYLVALGNFVSVDIMFLMVGHTHEDVDQFFAVVCEYLGRRRDFQVPMDVITYLREALQERVARKGEEFKVSWVSGVRDYNAWLNPLQVKLYNAFMNRHGDFAPHSFSFRRRGALTTAQADTVEDLPGHQGPNALEDVVCCVKEYMRSIGLMHPPVLVIPACRRGLVTSRAPTFVLPKHPLTPEDITNYGKLAAWCAENGRYRAAAELQQYLQNTTSYCPPLVWLETATPAQRSPEVMEGNVFSHTYRR